MSREHYLNSLENNNSKRSILTIFNKAKSYEEKYNVKLENFTLEMLKDLYINEFKGKSKHSVSVKNCNLKKYLLSIGNKEIEKIDSDFLKSLVDDTITYIKIDELIELIETNFINDNDKALVLLLYYGIKGKSKLTELRFLKENDIDFKTNEITLPNRKIKINNQYLVNILKKACKETMYKKYTDKEKDMKSSKYILYNTESIYLFKSKPSKNNNNGLDPLSFANMTSRLHRLTKLIKLEVQEIFQCGLCSIIDMYEKEHNKKMSMNEIEFYLKKELKIESVYAQGIYNMLKKYKEYKIEENEIIELKEELKKYKEGSRQIKKTVSNKIVRNKDLPKDYKKHFRNKHDGYIYCEICNEWQDLEEMLQVHHILEISKYNEKEYSTFDDVILLCPNCHKLVHLLGDIDKVKEYLKSKNKK